MTSQRRLTFAFHAVVETLHVTTELAAIALTLVDGAFLLVTTRV